MEPSQRAKTAIDAVAKPSPPGAATPEVPADTVVPKTRKDDVPPARQRRWFALRQPVGILGQIIAGMACLGLVFSLWWAATRGEMPEDRLVPYTALPSPVETFDSFHSLWFERALARNTLASLRRVALGFGLAAVVGVPVGILCGCFTWAAAFLAPLTIFGRNIPVAALVPLTFALFGIAEQQKVMFLFIACVAFVVIDTATAIADVSSRYIDTAYTLGASRWQIIRKVLIPLALPSVFNSLRLLFGLAFGYIMLAELVKFGSESGGLGDIIITSQRRGPREHIILVLLIIPIVALLVDRLLYWIQRQLFPHQYGSAGYLSIALGGLGRMVEALKSLIIRPTPLPTGSLRSKTATNPGAAGKSP